MPLLRLPWGRKKTKKTTFDNTTQSEDAGPGFFQYATNTVFNQPVTMIDKPTIVNNIDQGRTVLEVLSREMTRGADVDSSARYPPPLCYPGTRKTVIAKIQNWLSDEHREWDILWLHGPAGVGKSAVAQTIAESAMEKDWLGAAFFFSKINGRNNPHSVFVTLAYQLSVRFPGYRPLVAKQLAADPDLLHKAPHVQFKKLIVEPLSSLTNQPKHLIILDGLDECDGEQAQLDIIELINNLILSQISLPIIWMICSRPESHLRYAFSRADFTVQCWRQELPVGTQEARDDTARFIRARFEEIHKKYMYCVHEDNEGFWPPEDAIMQIVDEVSGLFAYASIILNYIEDPESGNPDACLANVLTVAKHSHHLSGGSSPMDGLDLLYSRILSEVPSVVWPTTERLLAVAVKPPIPLFRLSTAQLLSNLLGITRSNFYTAVRKLHSVLDVPPPEEAKNRPLRFFHASFRDYLVHPARSGRFCLIPQGSEQRDDIQVSSLRIISSLTSILGQSRQPQAVPSAPKLVRSRVDQILNQYLPWRPLDPTLNREFADRLAHMACYLFFQPYSKFRTREGSHHSLKSSLRTFDFNSFAFLTYERGAIQRWLPDFINWIKRTSLHGLVRTHSTGETDDKLLAYLKELEIHVESLDFDYISTHRSFDELRKPVYFLLGYDTNAVLLLTDGNRRIKGPTYYSLKSPSEVWPSLPELLDESRYGAIQSALDHELSIAVKDMLLRY